MSKLDELLYEVYRPTPELLLEDKKKIKNLLIAIIDEAAKTHTMNKKFTTDYQNAFLNGIEAMQISLSRRIKDL